MATVDALFAQADVNHDQRFDLNEFQNFIGATDLVSGTRSYSVATESTDSGPIGSYDSSSYQSSSYESPITDGALSDNLAYAEAENGITTQTNTVQRYETDAQGIFIDPNPQIVRRPAAGGTVAYTQNIRVRFLQPPPIPPPGPLIIKEVRPPQPPPPPPLRLRQQPPPLPQPPPLILREQPPVPPASTASQTIIRRLAAPPVPPRSVIIERLPALPPKPRDIIIERWIPYGVAAKRKVIVQRAAAAQPYPEPRNIVIHYEPIQVRVVRQFQRLDVTQENPVAYAQRYGESLLDTQTLLTQARAAGVVEDISAPALTSTIANHTIENVANFDTEVSYVGGTSSYESSSYSAAIDTSRYGAGIDTNVLVDNDLDGTNDSASTATRCQNGRCFMYK
ncbi:unnamed protein product [Adineta steineri]|uniref:EF-hand domain-containing protein n=1 Tax=Adineta steineri TaxID=433720 RepID=A0A818TAJ7_9BILA|nr:unnamed protein product [Adineta steineri]CAF3677210.1 unnamed protein product [Adineta steineri]